MTTAMPETPTTAIPSVTKWPSNGAYRAQLSNFLYVQPNIQYIVQPGGTGSIPDAFVLGMQIGVTF